MMKKNISIIIPYCFVNNRYYLWGQIRSDNNAELDLKWEFPGGKVISGEDPKDAAIREFREEVDVCLDKENLINLGGSEFEYSDRSLTFHLYCIEVHLQDLPEAGWKEWNLSLESNLTRKIPAANLDFLLKLRQYLLS